MKSKLLLPERYKWIGVVLTIPSLLLGIANLYWEFQIPWLQTNKNQASTDFFSIFSNQNFTDELATTGLIIGLLFIAFSKETSEDEFVSKIRLESLQWAVLVNAVILLLCTLLVYGGGYFSVIIYNMFTPLIFFILRFHYMLYRNQTAIEKS